MNYLKRYLLAWTILSAVPVIIFIHLIDLQTSPDAEKFRNQGQNYLWVPHTYYPARGQIYDRWGSVLAANKMVYEVGVELDLIRNPHTIAVALNTVLGLDYTETLKAIDPKFTEGLMHVVLADNIEPEKIKQLEALEEQMQTAYADSNEGGPPSLRGLSYTPHLMRTYPEKSLASNILGFVMRDNKGYFGVEEKYNDMLAGTPVTVSVPQDPNQVEDTPDVPDGASLVLTIDREMQAEVEQILDDAIDETGSQSGTILVLQPETGEVLSMATTPRLDLNEYYQYQEIFVDSTPFNRAVSQSYEPGSVYKVLTMAAALDDGAVKPETSFLDTGVFEIGGALIYNWNSGAWGPQDMTGCMQHSLNVCLAWIATQLGAKDFYVYMDRFGIGKLTGVDMAKEVTGRLKTPGDDDWYDADLGTNSFGQGVSATPIQMAAAISSVANDGQIMAPHVVRSIINKGYQRDIEIRPIAQPLKAETAHTLTEMLANSLEQESSDAVVTGYRTAGKTGTAEIATPYGYTSNETNASFVGWGPVDDPKFLVYIWLEKPSVSPWGSVVAAPVFKTVVEHLVVLMNIPPDAVREQILTQ